MTEDTVKKVAEAIREHIKVDATGLAPSVVSAFVTGFEDAARAAISAMSEWRPIDDEARSGKPVLAIENFQRASYDDAGNEKLHAKDSAVVWWHKTRKMWIGFGLGLESFEPTHYSPLPLPPEGE